MVEIVFETHSTTTDNEDGVASGRFDASLSELGKKQAEELGERRGKEHFDMIFCSDLERSYDTADRAFYGKFPIKRDKRLSECDYGELTGKPEEMVKPQKPEYIHRPFPGGQSYEETTANVKSFLEELLRDYDGKRVMIIGHRATQYALEHLINGVSLEEAVTAPWKWQPGWTYHLKSLS